MRLQQVYRVDKEETLNDDSLAEVSTEMQL